MSLFTNMKTEDCATARSAMAADLGELNGRSLCEGRFLVEAQLGRGAQGAVFRIRRTGPTVSVDSPHIPAKLDRYIPRPQRTPTLAAMKVLFPDPSQPEITERFLAEYRIAARLHEGLFVRSYELFEDGALLCYSMDLMLGGSLAGTSGSPLPVAVAVGVVLDILEGLDVLHSQGIVHRDIKHHNILLDGPLPSAVPSAGTVVLPHAKLADFGISDVQDMVFGDRIFDTQMGTPYFMAPEFGVRDTVDARVDLYAAGVVLFMLLTGLHPGSRSTSRGSTERAVQRQLAGEALQALRLQEIAPQVPQAIAEVVNGLLDPDPNRRLRTAALAFDALYAWFAANQGEHHVQLSHRHTLHGKPYLAAAAFSGRRSEMAKAESFLRTQLAGETEAPVPAASVLAISGEAGMGKSRLTHGIRRKAQRLGFAVHTLVAQRGQGAFTALDGLRQHFRGLYAAALQQATPEQSMTWRDPHDQNYVPDRDRDAAYMLLRQPEIRPEERPAYNELSEQYLLDRFAAEVRFASFQIPQCIIVEDAQWLDAGTIKYLFWCMRFISSSKARGMPVQVAWVLNHRPRDPDGDSVELLDAQLANLARMEAAPLRIELVGFSEPDACDVVASMLQLPVEATEVHRLVAALKQQRDLSPLYVEQSVWTLFAMGNLAAAEPGKRWEGQWRLDAANLAGAIVPSSVREAIGNRSSRLSAETLRILGVAAVAGKGFDVEVVARAGEMDAENVLIALEQAGGAGFVVQEQGQSRRYLADGAEGDIRYRFSHDRYRESIFSGLEPTAKRTIHGQLARAIVARWGEKLDTHPMLAEHYFGAEEYMQAYENAKIVAQKAHGEGNHERAADYFRLTLDSHRLAQQSVEKDSAMRKLRDQAAESLAAVGRFEEANAQLRILMEDKAVPKQKQLDCQRRIAASYFIQHDFANAIEQLTNLLSLLGVNVKEQGLKRALVFARGSFALFVRVPFGLGFNRQPAENPGEETMIIQTLYSLIECSVYMDIGASLYALLYQMERITTRGLHSFSPTLMQSAAYIFASYGLPGLSRHCEKQIDELFPELTMPSVRERNNGPVPQAVGSAERHAAETRAIAFILLAGARLYRGDIHDPNLPDITDFLRQGIEMADRAANLQRRATTRAVNYYYCLFTGRMTCFQMQIQASLDMLQRTRIFRRDSIVAPLRDGLLHEVAGRLGEAAICYQESAELAQKFDSFLEASKAQGSALLCLALHESVPPQGVVLQALDGANQWLQHRMSNPVVICLACFIAAAAVTLARHGVKEIPHEFSQTMRRARRQAMVQHQQRHIYVAAEATVHWMQQRCRQALALFAEASTSAAREGYLFQLLLVLRIAVRVLPKSHAAYAYYREWQIHLQQHLNDQPVVKLRDVEDAVFPAMPDIGQPMATVPR